MRSLGPESSSVSSAGSSSARQFPLKAGNISMAVLVLVFLVAVVFAANENDVIGWIVVAVSLAWLIWPRSLSSASAAPPARPRRSWPACRPTTPGG